MTSFSEQTRPLSRPNTMSSSPAPQETVLASWVHVSDLHFGHGDPSHQWNQRLVLDELLTDAQALVREKEVPRPNFIFVTGDIACSGGVRTPEVGEAEYTVASDWLHRFQQALEVRTERVFMVPGNHDIDRRAEGDVQRLLKMTRAGDEPLDEALRRSVDIGRLRERMAGYLTFARNFSLPTCERFHEGLWWRQRIELAEGVSLRVCGLNTALLSLDDKDHGKLRIGQRQLAELFVPAPSGLELVLVLGHHPTTGRWLADEKELLGQLDRLAALYLFGHLHETDSEQARHGWGDGCLRIGAGAAHADAASSAAPPVAHRYNFGALVALGTGDLVVRLWPRRWSTISPRFVRDVDHTQGRREYAEHRLPEKFRRPAPTVAVEILNPQEAELTSSETASRLSEDPTQGEASHAAAAAPSSAPVSAFGASQPEESVGDPADNDSEPTSRSRGWKMLVLVAVAGFVLWAMVLRDKPESPGRPAVSDVLDLLKSGSSNDDKPPVVQTQELRTCAGDVDAASTGGRTGRGRWALLNVAKMEFVSLASGEYTRGSEDGRPNEQPRHRICLQPFEIAKSEVTFEQWDAVMPEGRRKCGEGCSLWASVKNVTWIEAVDFLNFLSEREGFDPCYEAHGAMVYWNTACDGYRLPTEAEWEYAARAGTDTIYSFGGHISGYDAFSRVEQVNSGWSTIGLGRSADNAWGLRSVHDDVWEWTWDRYGDYEAGSFENPLGPNHESSRQAAATLPSLRVIRGGKITPREPSRLGKPSPSAYRMAAEASLPGGLVGLRVARSKREEY